MESHLWQLLHSIPLLRLLQRIQILLRSSRMHKHVIAEAELAQTLKKGMATGEYVIHPITGEDIPVWIANFVLMDYGSGAVMAVPVMISVTGICDAI